MPRYDPIDVLNRLVRKFKARKRVRNVRGDFFSPQAEEYCKWVDSPLGLGQTWCVRKVQLSHLFQQSLVADSDDRRPAFSPVQWFDEETALFSLPCGSSERVMHLLWRADEDYFDRKLSRDECLELSLRCRNVFILRFRIVATGFGGW